jgi:hypothetical protein
MQAVGAPHAQLYHKQEPKFRSGVVTVWLHVRQLVVLSSVCGEPESTPAH